MLKLYVLCSAACTWQSQHAAAGMGGRTAPSTTGTAGISTWAVRVVRLSHDPHIKFAWRSVSGAIYTKETDPEIFTEIVGRSQERCRCTYGRIDGYRVMECGGAVDECNNEQMISALTWSKSTPQVHC